MKILKVSSLIIYLCVVQSECGVIESFLGTIKNTTKALKADAYNFVAFGNDVVFGDTENLHVLPDGQVIQEHKTKGLITGFFHKAKNAVDDLNQNVKNIFHISKNGGTKTLDTVYNELNNAQDEIKALNEHGEGKVFSEDPKVTRDNIVKFILRNNTDLLKTLNISEVDIQNLLKGNKDLVKIELVLPTGDKVNGEGLIDIRTLDV